MQNFPRSIKNENDLDAYGEYLNNDTSDTEADTARNNTGISSSRQLSVPQKNNMSYIPRDNMNVPQMLQNSAFMPAFLSKHIGKLIKAESLMGDRLETKIGVLMNVGAGFIVLRQFRSNNTVICDLYSIKYITVVHDNDPKKLLP